MRWVLACVGLFVVIGALFLSWGWSLFTSQARTALNENPVIQTHIGKIQQMDINLSGTISESGADVFVFDLVGTKGRGTVIAEFVTVDADTERIGSGIIRLPDGSEHTLVPKD